MQFRKHITKKAATLVAAAGLMAGVTTLALPGAAEASSTHQHVDVKAYLSGHLVAHGWGDLNKHANGGIYFDNPAIKDDRKDGRGAELEISNTKSSSGVAFDSTYFNGGGAGTTARYSSEFVGKHAAYYARACSYGSHAGHRTDFRCGAWKKFTL